MRDDRAGTRRPSVTAAHELSLMSSLAIVPAAGRSERFGLPKLSVDFEGEPLISRTLRALVEGGVARIVVVAATAATFDRLPGFDDPRVMLTLNPDPKRGMFSSLQTGLATAEGDPILILPGDMPFVRSRTVAAVLAAYAAQPGIIVPTFAGRHGHPIALPASIRAAALVAPATSALDALLVASRLLKRELLVDDEGVLRDVDTPSDLVWRRSTDWPQDS